MRVLQVVPTIGNESAGPSYSVPGLCRGLVNSSCQVNLLFTGTCPNREFPFDVTVSSIVKWPLARLGRSPEMYCRLLQLAETADVIHNNSFWMFPNVYPYQVVQKLKRAGKKAPKLVNAPRGTLAAWSLKRHAWQKRLFGWFAGQYAAMRATDMWHATCEKEYEEIRAAGFKQPVAIVPIGMEVPEVSLKLEVGSSDFGVQSSKFGVQCSGVCLYATKKDGAPTDSILENPEDGPCASYTQDKVSRLQLPVKGDKYHFTDSRLHRLAFFGRLHTVKRIDMLLRAWELLTQLERSMSGGSTAPNNSNIGNSPQPYLLSPIPSPLSPLPSPLTPQPSTLNPQLSTQNWELVIAGPDGGVRAELESYIATHRLPRVRFVGEINGSAKYDFLTAADLYVLPSATENFGVTLAEALACGTPSLGSKGTPWSELNEWHCGSWGFDTAEELAAELAKLMALSDEERMEIGKRGQELIRTNYSWDGIGQKMRMAYEWLCHGGTVPDWVRID